MEEFSFKNWAILWLSGEQLSYYMLALTKYDQWKQNTAPDLTVTVTNADNVLIQSTFNTVNQAPVETSMFFEKISTKGLINFEACCVGEASVVFGATFVPSEIPSDPIDRGITVSRIIQIVDPLTNLPIGGAIFEAPIGQLVLTTIEIIIRDFGNSLKIVDAFPGALYPLDDSIYDVNTTPTWPYLWWFYYYGAFSQKEFLQDKVVFTGFNVYPGTYTVKYYSLVSTSGKFVLPPTLAYDVFQPELMGTSAGGTFSTPGYSTSPIVDMGACLPWVDRRPIVKYPTADDVTSSSTDSNNNNGSLSVGLGVGLGIGIPAIIAVASIVFYKFFYHTAPPVKVEPPL